jgi:shikimate dehydrogenase
VSDMYRFAVIGENISYSKSPEIFSAILEQLDLRGRCDILSIASEQLQAEIKRLQAEAYQGLSVTIPHKQAIMPFLDSIDRAAGIIGSVNSVKLSATVSEGHNTDWFGFVYAIKTMRILSAGTRAMVIGTGGAAAAIIYALNKSFGIKKIQVYGRSDEKLKRMQAHFGPLLGMELGRAWNPGGRFPMEEFDLIVNCTPVGGWHFEDQVPIPDWARLSKAGLYCDLNYNMDNRTVQKFISNGFAAIDGSGMLVAQAIRSFEIWTGRNVSFDPVYSKVFGAHGWGTS